MYNKENVQLLEAQTLQGSSGGSSSSGGGSSVPGSSGGGGGGSSSSIPEIAPIGVLPPGDISSSDDIVGGDRDENGCIGSAGYQWNKAANKCIRPWESKVVTMTI